MNFVKKLVLLFVFPIFATGSFCYGQANEKKLSASEKAYILSRFCTEVKYNFTYFDKLKFDWDSLCAALC